MALVEIHGLGMVMGIKAHNVWLLIIWIPPELLLAQL
jgi:hypothetical protein